METVIELLLPYLQIKDIRTIGNTNKYWKNRLDNILVPNHNLTCNYSDKNRMAGTVIDFIIPPPSICNREWKDLFILHNESIPEFHNLCFFSLAIYPKRGNILYNMYKEGDDKIKWMSSEECRFEFRRKDPLNLKKIEMEFRLKS